MILRKKKKESDKASERDGGVDKRRERVEHEIRLPKTFECDCAVEFPFRLNDPFRSIHRDNVTLTGAEGTQTKEMTGTPEKRAQIHNWGKGATHRSFPVNLHENGAR